jgi:2-amino-4-hydroxy-6-hydroxymethyldihydropteridine diphosphokinase
VLLKAVVGLGANLGEPLATMRAAVRAIEREPGARVEAASQVYATAPVGPPQPEYRNAAVRVAYEGDPEALLDALLAIETRLGRVRREGDVRWGPRVIDLDLLWVDGVTRDGPRLTLPHPRLRERAFALVPLVEVAPDARDPRTGELYAEIVSKLTIPAGSLSAVAGQLTSTPDCNGSSPVK